MRKDVLITSYETGYKQLLFPLRERRIFPFTAQPQAGECAKPKGHNVFSPGFFLEGWKQCSQLLKG